MARTPTDEAEGELNTPLNTPVVVYGEPDDEVEFHNEIHEVEPSFPTLHQDTTQHEAAAGAQFAAVESQEKDDFAKDNKKELQLEDLIDIVTVFQCKFCKYNCIEKSLLVNHIRSDHQDDIHKAATSNEASGSATISESPKFTEISDDTPTMTITSVKHCERFQDEIPEEEPPPLDIVDEVEDDNGEQEQSIFLCSFCNTTFDFFADCENHMRQTHYEVMNFAEASSSSTQQISAGSQPPAVAGNSLSKYYTTTLPETPMLCGTPAVVPLNLPELHMPLMDTMASRRYRCTQKYCTQRFRKIAALQYHQQSHLIHSMLTEEEKNQEEQQIQAMNDKGTNTDIPKNLNQLYKCPECGLRIISWKTTVLHLWKAHQIDCDLYTCCICDFKTPSYYKLLNHNQIHSTQRNYVCMVCGKDFKQVNQLRNHMIIHKDKNSEEAKDLWYSPKTCDLCLRTFSGSKCLKKHIETVHMKVKKFDCPHCDYTAARKSMLQMHIRQHTGEKPYKCDYFDCSYRTCDHNSLRRHRMKHSGEKPYKCPHCSYACIQAVSYKQHILKKHPQIGKNSLFHCNRCKFKTVSLDKMTAHAVDHDEREKREFEQREQETKEKQLREKIGHTAEATTSVASGSSQPVESPIVMNIIPNKNPDATPQHAIISNIVPVGGIVMNPLPIVMSAGSQIVTTSPIIYTPTSTLQPSQVVLEAPLPQPSGSKP